MTKIELLKIAKKKGLCISNHDIKKLFQEFDFEKLNRNDIILSPMENGKKIGILIRFNK